MQIEHTHHTHTCIFPGFHKENRSTYFSVKTHTILWLIRDSETVFFQKSIFNRLNTGLSLSFCLRYNSSMVQTLLAVFGKKIKTFNVMKYRKSRDHLSLFEYHCSFEKNIQPSKIPE